MKILKKVGFDFRLRHIGAASGESVSNNNPCIHKTYSIPQSAKMHTTKFTSAKFKNIKYRSS